MPGGDFQNHLHPTGSFRNVAVPTEFQAVNFMLHASAYQELRQGLAVRPSEPRVNNARAFALPSVSGIAYLSVTKQEDDLFREGFETSPAMISIEMFIFHCQSTTTVLSVSATSVVQQDN